MPLYWQFDSRRRLVTAVAEADVAIGDLDAYLDAVVGVGALGWRKLFDARDAKVALSSEEVLALGARIRGLQLLGTVGPLAFVLPKAEADGIARLLAFMAAADRQMRVFKAIGPGVAGLKRGRSRFPESSRNRLFLKGNPMAPSSAPT